MPRLRTLVNSRPKARSVAGVFATMRYMPFESSDRLRGLVKSTAEFLAGLGEKLDLVVQEGEVIRIERVTVTRFSRILERNPSHGQTASR